MKAILIIETNKGFAIAPYTGPVPDNFVESMSVATKLSSYSYANETVIKALEDYFEPAPTAVLPPVELKVAA